MAAYRYYSLNYDGVVWQILGWSRTGTSAAKRPRTSAVVEASTRDMARRRAEAGRVLDVAALRRLARS